MFTAPTDGPDRLRALAFLARGLAKMHMNHSQRRERIALIGTIINDWKKTAEPAFLAQLNALYLVLLTLYTGDDSMTHRDVKGGLRFLAELIDQQLTVAAADDMGIPF